MGISRSGSVPVRLNQLVDKQPLKQRKNIGAPFTVETVSADPPSGSGLSSGVANLKLRSSSSLNNLASANNPSFLMAKGKSPPDYADSTTFIADNAGELWQPKPVGESLDKRNSDEDLASQASHIFHTSGRFAIDDSSPESAATMARPFATGAPTESGGFGPDSQPTGTTPMEVDLKTEGGTQAFDSQTYHSLENDTLVLCSSHPSTANSNQNCNVKHNHSSTSSSSSNANLSQNTSTTQSSSTPTQPRQPSPVLPATFDSPFASQRRRTDSTMDTESSSPRRGLPLLSPSPGRVVRSKQENRTYCLAKVGDLYRNIHNFVEMRSFNHRTLHFPRESQHYREKGGMYLTLC